MAKLIAMLLIGVLAGAGVVYLSLQGSESESTSSDVRVESTAASPAAQRDADALIAEIEALPPGPERAAFESDALAKLAESDLAGALSIAMAHDNDVLQQLLITRIGEGVARRDPVAALAEAESLGSAALSSGLTLGILEAWSVLDPVGMLDWLATADPNRFRAPIAMEGLLPGTPVPFDQLVLGDPEGVLSRLDEFSGSMRRDLERAALLALAETDAIGTLARLDSIPPGRDRNELMEAVAETYGRQDPSAALAWVTSMSPPLQDMLNGVVSGIASADVNRALDWVLRELESPTVADLDPVMAFPVTPIFQAVRNGALPMPRTVERLLAADNPTLRSRATAALMTWSESNAQAAVDFAVGRVDVLTPQDLTSLAMRTASSAPEVAMQTPERLPPEHRAVWVTAVSDQLVRAQPERAIDFLAGQRGQPGYDTGVMTVVRQLAPADPQLAATLVADSDASADINTAARIVAGAWRRQDPEAAENWVLGLPAGESRDAGILGLLAAEAAAGEFNSALLDSMSSDAARQQGASRVILQIARTDEARARALLNTYVTDPEQRAQLEAQLERVTMPGASLSPLPTINFTR